MASYIEEAVSLFQSMEWYGEWRELVDPAIYNARTPEEALWKAAEAVFPNMADLLVSSFEIPVEDYLVWEDRNSEWEEAVEAVCPPV